MLKLLLLNLDPWLGRIGFTCHHSRFVWPCSGGLLTFICVVVGQESCFLQTLRENIKSSAKSRVSDSGCSIALIVSYIMRSQMVEFEHSS